MKKKFLISFFIGWLIFLFVLNLKSVFAAQNYTIQITPVPCSKASGLGDCPTDLSNIYESASETCVSSYETFVADPINQHFWAADPDVTAQGKADERARQFIYWAMNRNSVDSHSVLKQVWKLSSSVVFFLIVIVVAITGIGIIIGQKANFDFKIQIWPIITRTVVLLLYVAFSATIVLILISISELLMKFFIENLGGKDLFNIYFSSVSHESNYVNFVGCRDLNYKVQEAANTEMFLLKLTNITYYVLGGMFILRKVVLWFLLFISPFLALLAPFVFIRNIGWIWIGVFFQWLFYGPMTALFLGGVSAIWKAGIPYAFDFSRVNSSGGYIYPTAINIVYGGPAQISSNIIGALNNGNYVDTFVEYVISLIMLWTVIVLPWWLLRIFRDYCCDGIYAAKNILLSMYDQMRGGPGPSPKPPFGPADITNRLKIPKTMEIPIKLKLETIEEIKKTKTEDITRSLNISTKRLTDIAQFETNKQTQQNIRQNIDYLANPLKAETPTERQKYMNLRTELFNRAVKQDHLAQNILSSISTSKIEQIKRREELIKTIPKTVPVTHIVSVRVKLPQDKVGAITTTLVTNTTKNTEVMTKLAQNTKLENQQIQTILQSLAQNIDQPITEVVEKIAKETGLSKEKITAVLKIFSQSMKENKGLSQEENLVAQELPVVAEAEKHVEETISIPPSVAIEDYENVKKMWKKQYEAGEVPVTENIKSRFEWVDKDIVFITNTLNKLVSANPEIKQQGLDDLSFILPIFLINNLKGEELIVYLKAKLEAARTVHESLQKEREITEKLKAKTEEEVVEVPLPKKAEEAKTMEMKKELKIENNN